MLPAASIAWSESWADPGGSATSALNLVCPEISGLTNPAALSAAWDVGIRFLVSDTSRAGWDNPAPNMFNVPLAAGSGSREFRAAVTKTWLPALEEFRPEMVFFSAGFDAHTEDDMAMLRFTDGDYGWVTEQVKAIADRYADGRIVSLLEGGYALSALGRSAVQHVRVLAGLNR